MKTAIELITEERQRQIEKKGWTPEHDDEHGNGELLDAGLSYIYAAINIQNGTMVNPPHEWPWAEKDWKPSDDPLRNLTKAAALIAAEIDRINRIRP